MHREGVGIETGNKVFDPMGLSKIASEETLAWYRAAELKHSRVAMVSSGQRGVLSVMSALGLALIFLPIYRISSTMTHLSCSM